MSLLQRSDVKSYAKNLVSDLLQDASKDIRGGVKWIVVRVGNVSSANADYLEMLASGPGDKNVLTFENWCDLIEEITSTTKKCCKAKSPKPKH